MSEEIKLALIALASASISALLGFFGTVIVTKRNNKKQRDEEVEREKARAEEEAVWRARLEDHLAIVDHKLDVHNGYAEKFGDIRDDISSIRTEVAVINTKIESLKEA